eukprot:GHVT01103745.1.p1 GENE.GHVT01103745.1~~GHVT01103745.1.p1  ORF type:complete len:405 (-),score=65.56 GHVT01103745.1:289-1503(-)
MHSRQPPRDGRCVAKMPPTPVGFECFRCLSLVYVCAANDASSITTDASTFPLSEPVTVEEETSTGAPSVAASNTCQPCGNNNTEAPGSDSLNLNSDCPEPDQSPQQKLQTQGGHSSNKPVNTCITDVKSSESTTSPTSSPAPSTSSLPGPASPEVSTEASAHEDTEAQASGVATVSKNNKKKKWLDKGKDWFKQFFRKSSDSNVSNKKSNGGSSSNAASSQASISSKTSLSGWPLAKQTSAGAARSRSAIGESSAPGAVEISLRAATSNSVGDQVRLDLSEQPFSVTTNSDAGRTNEINPTLKRQLVIASFALGLSSLFSLTGWAIWKRKMSGSQRCPKRYTSTQKMTSVEEASSTLRSGSVAVATRLQRGRPGEKGAVTQMGQPAARLHSLDATKPANGLQSD